MTGSASRNIETLLLACNMSHGLKKVHLAGIPPVNAQLSARLGEVGSVGA